MTARYYVAAEDATPEQIGLGKPYKRQDEAQKAADAWNMRRPNCPVIVWQSGGSRTTQLDLFA